MKGSRIRMQRSVSCGGRNVIASRVGTNKGCCASEGLVKGAEGSIRREAAEQHVALCGHTSVGWSMQDAFLLLCVIENWASGMLVQQDRPPGPGGLQQDQPVNDLR